MDTYTLLVVKAAFTNKNEVEEKNVLSTEG